MSLLLVLVLELDLMKSSQCLPGIHEDSPGYPTTSISSPGIIHTIIYKFVVCTEHVYIHTYVCILTYFYRHLWESWPRLASETGRRKRVPETCTVEANTFPFRTTSTKYVWTYLQYTWMYVVYLYVCIGIYTVCIYI